MGITVFTPAPRPQDDYARGQAVLESGMLASDEGARLTLLALEAKSILAVDWAGVTLVIDDWQHVIASSGGMLGLYRRSTSMSAYVIDDPSHVLCIPDTRQDPRFEGSPFVEDGLIGFYAGAAILDVRRHAIGVFCVTGRAPRVAFTVHQQSVLMALADRVVPKSVGAA